MEEIGIINVKERFFHPPDIDPPRDHLLQDAAVGQVSLQESTDDLSIPVDDLFIDIVFAEGLHPDAFIGGVGIDFAQRHGGDVQEPHSGLGSEKVCHLFMESSHVSGGDHALLDGHRPDRGTAGDIAGSVDIRVACAPGLIIDQPGAGELEPGILKELDVGADPRSDDKIVTGDDCPVAEDDRRDLMVIVDLHFVDTYSVVLFHSAGFKGVDIGLRRFPVELLVKEPAGKIAEDDLRAQLEETGGTVDPDETGSEDNEGFARLRGFL